MGEQQLKPHRTQATVQDPAKEVAMRSNMSQALLHRLQGRDQVTKQQHRVLLLDSATNKDGSVSEPLTSTNTGGGMYTFILERNDDRRQTPLPEEGVSIGLVRI